jgi:hypothetical protein
MAILLFILAIIASFLVVRLGAVALALTGMEPKQARFQALSAFSGSGFTTKESELIVTHPARRKVVQLLIIGGNAGLVTMIATLAGSLGQAASDRASWELFGGAVTIPGKLIPYLYVMGVILFLIILYRLSQWGPAARLITRSLRAFLVRQGLVREVSFEEVLLSAEGFGISQIEIEADNPLLDKSLAESGLSPRDILVLMIERGEKTIVSPKGHNFARLGDRFTVFGPLETIRELAIPPDERDEPMPETEEEDEG